MMPEDRQFTIAEAAKQAAKHPDDYLSSHARGMKALREALAMRARA
jgi:aspartate/methionine/tyrosine aminotransferase